MDNNHPGGEPPEDKQPERRKPGEEPERYIDRIIRRAEEEGAFDNLPGKGKPIQWDDDALTPEDRRMAHRVLKNHGFTPDWIDLGKQLDAEYRAARAALDAVRGRPGYAQAAADFRDKVRAINRRLIGYNMRVPHERYQRPPYPTDPDTPTQQE